MQIQRALPCPEDVGPFAAGELANELPTATSAPLDFFDRNALVEKIADVGIGVLATQMPFVLKALGRRQQRRVYGRRAERGADRLHRPLNRVEKGRAGVLHQVPAISDLRRAGKRLRRRLAIATTSVSRDDVDLWMLR